MHWVLTSDDGEYTDGDLLATVVYGALPAVCLWGAFVGLRFAFHLVDCRHLTGKQSRVVR
jgi:hypothetical protein